MEMRIGVGTFGKGLRDVSHYYYDLAYLILYSQLYYLFYRFLFCSIVHIIIMLQIHRLRLDSGFFFNQSDLNLWSHLIMFIYIIIICYILFIY